MTQSDDKDPILDASSEGPARRRLLKLGGSAALASLGWGLAPASALAAADGSTKLTMKLPDNSKYPDTQAFILVLGHDPNNANSFGYVNAAGQFVGAGTPGSFVFSNSMSIAFSTLKKGTNKYVLSIPRISSARVYFAFGATGFAGMPSFSSGGPVMGPQNTVLFDKFELDTNGNPNFNVTNVDFYGVSFSIAAIEAGSGVKRTVGYKKARADVLAAFAAVPASAGNPASGNNAIFAAADIKNSGGQIVRILAPKAAGLSDWAGATLNDQVANATLASHFWDDYIKQQCWRPNRTFSCYSKLVDGKTYYGRVSADGLTLFLYTDAAMTAPYSGAPTLPRPCNDPGVPNVNPVGGNPGLYHNVNSGVGAIDWGFLIGGNVAGAGLGAAWATDPVAMAIMMSICRGVMHLDDGRNAWLDASKYYQGSGSGTGTTSMPIFHYAKILHDKSIDHKAYAFSYDDVYGTEPAVYFGSNPLTLTFAQF